MGEERAVSDSEGHLPAGTLAALRVHAAVHVPGKSSDQCCRRFHRQRCRGSRAVLVDGCRQSADTFEAVGLDDPYPRGRHEVSPQTENYS